VITSENLGQGLKLVNFENMMNVIPKCSVPCLGQVLKLVNFENMMNVIPKCSVPCLGQVLKLVNFENMMKGIRNFENMMKGIRKYSVRCLGQGLKLVNFENMMKVIPKCSVFCCDLGIKASNHFFDMKISFLKKILQLVKKPVQCVECKDAVHV